MIPCALFKLKFKSLFLGHYNIIPDAASASAARVGKEKERKTKDVVEENDVPSPDSFRTTLSLGGSLVFSSWDSSGVIQYMQQKLSTGIPDLQWNAVLQ